MVRKRKIKLGFKFITIIVFILLLSHNQEINTQINNSLNMIADRYLVKDEPYLMELVIPKINLKQKIYAKNSSLNNVKYHVMLLNESTMVNKEESYLILAAHSGTSRISYFRNLFKLDEGDEAYIYYDNKVYAYVLESKMEVSKEKYVVLKPEKNRNILTLVTCIGKEKRLIVNFSLK